MTVNEAIRSRRSIRRFKAGVSIPEEHIRQLLEAAMLAPSAHNSRPWHFCVVTGPAKLAALAKAHPYAKMLASASLAIVVCTPPENPLMKGHNAFYQQDCAAATQNILLEAVGLGYGSCWCGVTPKEKLVRSVQEILDIRLVPFNIIALGVPDEAPAQRGGYEENKVSRL